MVRITNLEKKHLESKPEIAKRLEKHRNSILNVKETRKIDQMMRCWNLRVRGYGVHKISVTLGLSGATVTRRLQEARKLLETQLLKLDENDQVTLANRLEYIFSEASEAWEKSKTTAITSLEDGKELIQTNPGDPRYLLTALESLKAKQRMMGLEDRKPVVNVTVANQIVTAISEEDRMREIAAELANLGILPSAITVVPEAIEDGSEA